MRATIEERASSDYSGLSMERVAARAGVNKTTVYRNWPSRADLVQAALLSVAQTHDPGPSSGSVRADLLRVGRRMLDFSNSFEGQCLMRMGLTNHPEPELAAIARSISERNQHLIQQLAREAVARGELADEADIELLLDLLGGAVFVRMFMKNQRVDDVLIARYVDMLLRGAQAPHPVDAPRRGARKPRA